MDRANILIVDDETINIDLIAKVLNNLYTLKIATTGKKALEIIQKSKPDLILLDIQMPDMDGFEVAKRLKMDESTLDIPFIFLTGAKQSDDIVKGFDLGAVDYITKPFNKLELLVRVRNHMKTYLLQRELKKQQQFTQTILDTQPNLILITDKNRSLFANSSLLEFFACNNLLEFQEKYHCICNTFLHNDLYFHLGKIPKDTHWIEYLLVLEAEKRIVSIVCQENFAIKAFNVAVTKYEEDKFIITLTDISATILKQIQLEEKTTHDKLTGAYNREYFDINYSMLLQEVKNQQYYLGVALIDIDHFKNVNDTFGHDIGDVTLITFVKTLQKHSRGRDKLIRWGGEEFIMLLYVDSKEGFEKALEHYRTVVEIQHFKAVENVTCSIGGSFYIEGENIQDTIKRADQQLYLAKKSGRNQVRIIYG